jgi:hypothetical protein
MSRVVGETDAILSEEGWDPRKNRNAVREKVKQGIRCVRGAFFIF